MKGPLVSIIIPTYNRMHLIGETLDSVISQSYGNWECIVVDDSSSDYTVELMEFYCERDLRIKYLNRPLERKKGANACRNFGFENSKGEFLVFLDSDDILNYQCLQERTRTASDESWYDFYVFPMKFFENNIRDGGGLLNNYTNDNSEYIELILQHKIPWPLTSLFIRKDIFIEFEEELERFQDVFFSLMLTLKYPEFKIVTGKNPDCYYRRDFNNRKKYNEVPFISIILNSFLLFVRLADKNVFPEIPQKNRAKYKKLLGKAYLNYIDLYIWQNLRAFEEINSDLFQFLNKNGYLSFSAMYRIRFFNFILKNESKIPRGIGIFRITRSILRIGK